MYGQFNPYAYGMTSPYQQRLSQLEQPVYQQPPLQPLQASQSAQTLRGRVVASVDEARAAQVDFDGSTTYFVCLGEQKIYAKSIGLNGLPVFLTYSLVDNQNVKPDGKSDLECRLQALEDKVKELSNEHTTNAAAGQ